MCNAANCAHLDDDLSDIFGPATVDAADLAAGVAIAASVEVKMHKETCHKCRGRGRFIGYTGRDFGPCFACKGAGFLYYRQSLEVRQRKAEQAQARKARVEADMVAAFSADHAAEAEWIAAASKRGFRFAAEMQATVAKFGRLTDKQLAAVQRFAAEDARRDAERAARASAPVARVTIDAIMDALKGSGLKRAALHFAEWKYSLAPESGANAGYVYVRDSAGEYLGKIGPDGSFRTVRECTPDQKAAIMAHVATMQTADQVRAAAILSGKETGACCCCGRELTDPNSIEAGIGPICASKWGF